jgi:hypothetical protein
MLRAKDLADLPHPHCFPELHSLLSFIGQFLPLFVQLGLSAANVIARRLFAWFRAASAPSLRPRIVDLIV